MATSVNPEIGVGHIRLSGLCLKCVVVISILDLPHMPVIVCTALYLCGGISSLCLINVGIVARSALCLVRGVIISHLCDAGNVDISGLGYIGCVTGAGGAYGTYVGLCKREGSADAQ